MEWREEQKRKFHEGERIGVFVRHFIVVIVAVYSYGCDPEGIRLVAFSLYGCTAGISSFQSGSFLLQY